MRKDNREAVLSLLIPLSGGQLLVPSAVVAEVINYRTPDILLEGAPGLMGMLDWRGHEVPLLSVEKALKLSVKTPIVEPRIAILYGLESPDSLPFYSLLTRTTPRTILVARDSFTSPRAIKRAGFLASISINQQTAWLPDLCHLEKLAAM
ncbi:MAG: hypothetical protein GY862_02465 [Gammaproteobacteria bacterium]|nr:hypothetical protein [Gammaproteobacteria bacterium]